MSVFEKQISRIKAKLVLAREADSEHKTFGASDHQYILHTPLKPEQVAAFELAQEIMLPACYKAFLTAIGNGGPSYMDSAAGPFYGIYPMEENTDEFIGAPSDYLQQAVNIYPGMPAAYWETLKHDLLVDNLADDVYTAALGRVFAGILPIGSQGCSYYHGLLLNGPHAGRVVNIDLDLAQPVFSFADNFLDWYEGWLDEVISGDLTADTAPWYGYRRSGSMAVLLEQYQSSTDPVFKTECLNGIVAKAVLGSVTTGQLEIALQQADQATHLQWLQILTKFDYNRAKPYLLASWEEHFQDIVKFIYWYAKNRCAEWCALVTTQLPMVQDGETFRFCTYLLTESQYPFGPLVAPFVNHALADIRVTALYTLGKLEDKSAYLSAFISGLKDESEDVIRTALQALSGVKDPQLLPIYKHLASKPHSADSYILSNLKRRLEEYPLTLQQLQQMP
ncbi:SMI1/KNR4 family protein SUKH-1 [Chitinophaga polysaccharea]|uniref:SMI1/KNR4 family protein SUKH-1 n=1 Tax=Chitinophaga polysaccharea TaxID=1293035 RepID=A0A561PWA3_9BACT|nr:SMI1/KNR4 family protein [Chitinophaga polysaccharea]TWF42348.1 SMI1/KNR4 family protein SUKH-1 [Chitinophaga polysaccharea]